MKIDPIRAGLALSVLAILYLTLYPFNFSSTAGSGLTWVYPNSRGEWLDVLLNVYLFVPFGFLGGLLVGGWRGALWFALAGAALSYGVESIQLYLPGRDASYRDVFLNTVGAFAGAGLGNLNFVRKLASRKLSPGWSPDRRAVLLAAMWVVAEWFPLMPNLRMFKLPRALLDSGSWVSVVAMAFAGFAISKMLPLIVEGKAVLWLRLGLVGAIPMQMFLSGRTVRPLEVAGAMAGMAAGAVVPAGYRMLSVVGLSVLAMRQFNPFHWETGIVNAFGWMPLAGAFGLPPEQSFRIMLEKLFFATYGIWALSRGFGIGLLAATAAVTVLMMAGEIGQMYQPGRVPEIGDLMLCGLGGLALALTGKRDRV